MKVIPWASIIDVEEHITNIWRARKLLHSGSRCCDCCYYGRISYCGDVAEVATRIRGVSARTWSRTTSFIFRTTSISDLWCSFSFSKTDIEHWRDSNNAKLLHFRCSHGRFGFRDYYTSYRPKSESSRADSLDSIIACNVSETREAHLNLITLKLDTVYKIFNTCTCRLCHLVALAILVIIIPRKKANRTILALLYRHGQADLTLMLETKPTPLAS